MTLKPQILLQVKQKKSDIGGVGLSTQSMGNLVSSAGPRATLAGIDSYVSELPGVLYEKSLGSSRFLKTIRCRHPEGLVVVKIFVKPEPGLSLKKYIRDLQVERDILRGVPNILPIHLVMESDRAGYMIRQYIASNLYDRISNRPFLTNLEKRWITYQILSGVAEAHSRQDNPADFTFFFDTSGRRACYLSPERFCDPDDPLATDPSAKLSFEMDIFSIGCTIAELFLEGAPLFTLSQLLEYRNGVYDPTTHLEKISDVDIRAMVKHMIQKDPADRLTVREYLTKWRDKAFPDYFYTFLHHYVASLSDPYYASNLAQYHVFLTNNPTAVIADSDAKVDRIYLDFDRIADALLIPNTCKPGDVQSDHKDKSDKEASASSTFVDGVEMAFEANVIK
ncbi:hypothetical protein BASA62_002193, partial [Batrachochytrium salamandrivorans]